MKLIAPSLLSADFGHLANEIEKINAAADFIHLDIMDGVFVPNISYGFPLIKFIKQYAQKPMDAHLMIVNPDNYIERFAEAGIANLSVHYETCTHLHRTLQTIRLQNMKAGVVLNPHTPVNFISEITDEIDTLLIMSVNPGFGGQKFIEHSYEKISEAKELLLKKNSKALIEVDGGVNTQNAAKLFAVGADILVAGNAVFSSKNPAEVILKMKNEI